MVELFFYGVLWASIWFCCRLRCWVFWIDYWVLFFGFFVSAARTDSKYCCTECAGECYCGEHEEGVVSYFSHSCFIFSFQSFRVSLCMFGSWRISPEICFSKRYGAAQFSHFVFPPKLQPPFSSQSFRQSFSSSRGLFM